MNSIEFKIPGKIQGKQRARVTKWGAYTPKNTVVYENLIKTIFIDKYGYSLSTFDRAVKIVVKAFFKIPSNLSSKKADKLLNQYCLKTPDADNILKSVSDGLNGVAYVDDKQICEMTCVKRWSKTEYAVINLHYEKTQS